MSTPRLRTITKVKPPYPLNQFPADFAFKVGRQIVYHLATDEQAAIEGKVWEKIFADAIGAQWQPSNVGLDDIRLGNCAWGAKTVKNPRPFTAQRIRLISGRNNSEFSFGKIETTDEGIGEQVLKIWNERVKELRAIFSHLRTVVLIKSNDLSAFVVFETDTVMYPPEQYHWQRNAQDNLEGYDKTTGEHRFTWQRHGSQFTIIETVPNQKLCFRVKRPQRISVDFILNAIGFDKSWVEIVK